MILRNLVFLRENILRKKYELDLIEAWGVVRLSYGKQVNSTGRSLFIQTLTFGSYKRDSTVMLRLLIGNLNL